jgi:hypothetical protein
MMKTLFKSHRAGERGTQFRYLSRFWDIERYENFFPDEVKYLTYLYLTFFQRGLNFSGFKECTLTTVDRWHWKAVRKWPMPVTVRSRGLELTGLRDSPCGTCWRSQQLIFQGETPSDRPAVQSPKNSYQGERKKKTSRLARRETVKFRRACRGATELLPLWLPLTSATIF